MAEKQKPPPVLYVDIDLTDNVPLPPPSEFQVLEGRSLLLYSSPDGRVLLIPRAPLRHPSAWGML